LIYAQDDRLGRAYFAAVEFDRITFADGALKLSREIRERIVASRVAVKRVQVVDAVAVRLHALYGEFQVAAVVIRTVVERRGFHPRYTGEVAGVGRLVAVERIVDADAHYREFVASSNRRREVANDDAERARSRVAAVVFSHVDHRVCAQRQARRTAEVAEGIQVPQVVAREVLQRATHLVHRNLLVRLRIEHRDHRADAGDARAVIFDDDVKWLDKVAGR
jgi:hypothetical protein